MNRHRAWRPGARRGGPGAVGWTRAPGDPRSPPGSGGARDQPGDWTATCRLVYYCLQTCDRRASRAAETRCGKVWGSRDRDSPRTRARGAGAGPRSGTAQRWRPGPGSPELGLRGGEAEREAGGGRKGGGVGGEARGRAGGNEGLGGAGSAHDRRSPSGRRQVLGPARAGGTPRAPGPLGPGWTAGDACQSGAADRCRPAGIAVYEDLRFF